MSVRDLLCAAAGASAANVFNFITATQKSAIQVFSTAQDTFFDVADDGTWFAVGENDSTNGRKIHKFVMSTPFDVSTATLHSSSGAFGTWPFTGGPGRFNHNGTAVIYPYDSATDYLRYIGVSPAYDASGISTSGTSQRAYTEDTSPVGQCMSKDGTRLYVYGTANDSVNQFTCNTAGSNLNLTYVNGFAMPAAAHFRACMQVADDGSGWCYSAGNGNSLYQYSMPTAWAVNTSNNLRTRTVPYPNGDTNFQRMCFKGVGKYLFASFQKTGNTTVAVYELS